MPTHDLLIFDLDGTLIDSKRDLSDSVNATRAWLGLQPLADELVFSYVGAGASVLVRRSLSDVKPALDEVTIERAHHHFLDYYRDHMLDATTLYPGVRDALDRLHSARIPMAILTNKPVRFSTILIQRLKLEPNFFRIYGGNSFEGKKPSPVGIDKLVHEASADRARTVMVGDSSVDVLTARNAGVRACGVSWGFQPQTFADTPPDFIIDEMGSLVEMVLRDVPK